MGRFSIQEGMRDILSAIRRLLRRGSQPEGDDPYALVTAPRKPRPPTRRSSIAAKPEHWDSD